MRCDKKKNSEKLIKIVGEVFNIQKCLILCIMLNDIYVNTKYKQLVAECFVKFYCTKHLGVWGTWLEYNSYP